MRLHEYSRKYGCISLHEEIVHIPLAQKSKPMNTPQWLICHGVKQQKNYLYKTSNQEQRREKSKGQEQKHNRDMNYKQSGIGCSLKKRNSILRKDHFLMQLSQLLLLLPYKIHEQKKKKKQKQKLIFVRNSRSNRMHCHPSLLGQF